MYQKPFVEFFASSAIVEKLEKVIGTVKGVVDFLAGNHAVRRNCCLSHISYETITYFVIGRANLRPVCERLSGMR